MSARRTGIVPRPLRRGNRHRTACRGSLLRVAISASYSPGSSVDAARTTDTGSGIAPAWKRASRRAVVTAGDAVHTPARDGDTTVSSLQRGGRRGRGTTYTSRRRSVTRIGNRIHPPPTIRAVFSPGSTDAFVDRSWILWRIRSSDPSRCVSWVPSRQFRQSVRRFRGRVHPPRDFGTT